MAEEFILDVKWSKEEKYKNIIPQIESLIVNESDLTANLANISSVLYFSFGFLWVGFYLVKGEELVLGPFHGPLACTRIAKGKGVCGSSWQKNEILVVDDVDQFPGHIACSSSSKSEIVLPLNSKQGEVLAVLDIDSEQLKNFDDIDVNYLKSLIKIIERKWEEL